jgi:chorismate mutase
MISMSIISKTADLLEKNNLQAKELNLKTLVPLIEQSSLEDDELLQTKWANLIANMCSSPETGLEPKLVKTLSNLSVIEAQVLDYLFVRFLQERQIYFDKISELKFQSGLAA